MSDASLYELLPLHGVGMLYQGDRAVCEVAYVIEGRPETEHPGSLWRLWGSVVPATGQSWLLASFDAIGAKASIDLRDDGLWWDCMIFDDGGTARPRRGAGLHRRP